MSDETTLDPRFLAATDLLGRTGAAEFQLRYSDDEEPVVWFAVARFRVGDDGRPRPEGPINTWESAAGHDPIEAVLRLCGQLIDGGECTHCHLPTMFASTHDETWPALVEQIMCLCRWDPELATFRRSCEGERP